MVELELAGWRLGQARGGRGCADLRFRVEQFREALGSARRAQQVAIDFR